MIRCAVALLLVLGLSRIAAADEFLTMCIDKTSGPGTLVVTGNFDVDFGFDTLNGPNGPKRYGRVELRDITPQEHQTHRYGAHPGKAVFILNRKNGPQESNQRIFLRFTSSSDNHFDIVDPGSVKLLDSKACRAIDYVNP
jgi:hypothetical protein